MATCHISDELLSALIALVYKNQRCSISEITKALLCTYLEDLFVDYELREGYLRRLRERLPPGRCTPQEDIPDKEDLLDEGIRGLSIQQIITVLVDPGVLEELSGFSMDVASDREWYQEICHRHDDLF